MPTTVTIVDPEPPIVAAIQSFCSPPNPTVNDLVAIGINISWYDSEDAQTPLDVNLPLEHNKTYWASQNSFPCESTERVRSTVYIDVSPNAGTSNNFTVCEIDLQQTNLFDQLGGNPDINGSWTGPSALNGGYLGTFDPTLHAEGTYTYTVSSALNICPQASATITVEILKTPPPTIVESTQTFCEVDSPTIANLTATGTNIQWYASETDTTPLNSTDALVDGATYWASQTNSTSDCESATRVSIAVVITNVPPPTMVESSQTFCEVDSPTIANLTATGTNILWYTSETDTTPLNSTDALVDGASYWATQTNSSTNCSSKERLKVVAHIINLSKPTTTSVSQQFCQATQPTIAALQINENVVWYASENATTPLENNTLLINGEDYWAAQTSQLISCESLERTKVEVVLMTVEKPIINQTNQTFCSASNPTVQNLQANGNQVKWYASENATIPLSENEALVNGASYWATQTLNGCESEIKSELIVALTTVSIPKLIASGNEFCKIALPTLNDLNNNIQQQTNSIISWYDSYPNGVILNLSEPLIDGKTYYAVETILNCDRSTALAVTVDLNKCEDYDIEMYDGFSPNGNGVNDTFTIKNLRALYPNFKVEFYNRWGALMYVATANKEDWNGRKNGNGELAPAGIYYYIIYFNKDNKKPIQNRLYLSR